MPTAWHYISPSEAYGGNQIHRLIGWQGGGVGGAEVVDKCETNDYANMVILQRKPRIQHPNK